VTLYLNKNVNLHFSQLQQLLSNFPAVGLKAVNNDFINYNGSVTPFTCTYNITSDSEVNYAILMIRYDSSSNIIIEATCIQGFGGASYVDTNSSGLGFGKISRINSYCGLLKHVWQCWTTLK
jgi:hypothetical protein